MPVTKLTRRAALCAAVACTVARPALAGSKLRRVVHGGKRPRGTALLFALENAPFGPGRQYDDPTVLAYVPPHYRLPASRAVDMVVHFHGHLSTAERAAFGHALCDQLDESERNAVLVVPQLAMMARDSFAGRLEERGGLERLLAELVSELGRSAVGAAMGSRALTGAAAPGMVCLSAHSGGYRAAAASLELGEQPVSECYLFDALYRRAELFGSWLALGPRKLVSFYAGGEVQRNNLALLAQLVNAGVPCYHEGRSGPRDHARLSEIRAAFIATSANHGDTTYASHNFRDCLTASGLAGVHDV